LLIDYYGTNIQRFLRQRGRRAFFAVSRKGLPLHHPRIETEHITAPFKTSRILTRGKNPRLRALGQFNIFAPVLTVKEISIGGRQIKLYSIDDGKLWLSNPMDIEKFQHRWHCAKAETQNAFRLNGLSTREIACAPMADFW
jgi:hypothetical protein